MIADRRAGHDMSASLAANTAGARLLSLAAHVNVQRPFLQKHPHFIHAPDATALAVATMIAFNIHVRIYTWSYSQTTKSLCSTGKSRWAV